MCLPKEQWIWLDDKLYPNQQTTIINGFQPDDGSFAAAEFIRKYEFEKQIVQAKLRFSGDTEYRLLCNGEFVATGPATIAGDFMCNDVARPWHYATQVNLPVNGNTLELYARVKLKPCGINEYWRGHGGWMLSGVVTFADGAFETITTDESWLCRHDRRFIACDFFVKCTGPLCSG